MEKMGDREFTKRVHISVAEGLGVTGRPLVKWEKQVEEYMREGGRGGLDQARRN